MRALTCMPIVVSGRRVLLFSSLPRRDDRMGHLVWIVWSVGDDGWVGAYGWPGSLLMTLCHFGLSAEQSCRPSVAALLARAPTLLNGTLLNGTWR